MIAARPAMVIVLLGVSVITFIILFAILMLGESLRLGQFLGMVLIISGVLVASASRPPAALVRMSVSTPRARMTLTGKTTSCGRYPS